MNHLLCWQRTAAVLGVLVCSLLHGTPVAFGDRAFSTAPHIVVLSQSYNSVSLRATVSSADVKNIDTRLTTDNGTEVFALLSLGEFAHTHEIGKPQLPVITTVLDVPHHAQIAVRIIDAEIDEITLTSIGIDKRLMPTLESVSKSSEEPAHFVIDEETYKQNAYYPMKIFEVEEYEGYARGHRLATLCIFPIHYNPVTHMLRVCKSITLEVNFVHGDIVTTKNVIARHYSHIWEEYIQSMVVNYPGFLRDVPPLPVYYDIFYHSAFAAAAESLANWKTKKGYKVRMWNAAGWSAQQIDDTIETQVPLATFLVIIGDPNSSTPLPPSGNGSSTYDQTDLYYAETDGSGYLPDLYNARIAALNATQAATVVDKAIRYEHANFGSAGFDWLKKACLIAGYDPYGNQAIGMATNWYCRNLLVAHGYQVDTLVYRYGEQEARVVNQINAGRAWCVFTAHGGRTEWWVGYSSDFNVSELTNQTNNLDMYPMPCGHCCLAADYQYSLSCFGETWDRLSGKGGICYFGSVVSTLWTEDDWLQRRYFDAIYADSVSGNLYETGRFTQWALYWINNNTGTSRKRYYFEAYHIFNDPSLDFWTDIPADLDVAHNSSVAPGTLSYTVTVSDNGTPLENALVCCWIPDQNPVMHVAGYTDASGTAILSVSPQNQGDTMLVTVTKHNYVPYEGYATIGADAPAAPFITLIEKAGSDINLVWHPVVTDGYGNPVSTDYYVIYRSISPTFIPNNDDSIGIVYHPDTSFTDIGALNGTQSYYYLVKAIDNSRNSSKRSNMAYVFHKFINENPNASDRNWIALPYCNNYGTVSDLVADLSPAGDPIEKITHLNTTLQLYESYVWLGTMWTGSDFALESGHAYEMVSTVDTELVLVGTNDPDGLIDLNENPATTDRNWVAMPYNAVYSTVSDITTEYAPSGTPIEKITRLDDTLQMYESYVWLGSIWTGPDFAIEPGCGYEFIATVDTFWNATEYNTERANKKTPLVEKGYRRSSPVTVHCGTSTEPQRVPLWKLTTQGYVPSDETAFMQRDPGVSHVVFLDCATEGLDDFVFTAYRPHMPCDVITEKTIGCGIATDGVRTFLWFDVGNFKKPWHHGENVILIVEASGSDNNYYHIQTITLDNQVDIQEIGTFVLKPFPELLHTGQTVQWPPINSENLIGYSVYKNGERLNSEIITTHSYRADDANVKFVLHGGHESVKASSSQEFEHSDLPRVSAFSLSPNPFMHETNIQYQVSQRGKVEFKVYDTSGRLVKILIEQTHDPGYYRTIWDAKDEAGRAMPAGIYFMTFTVGTQGNHDCTIVNKAVFVGK